MALPAILAGRRRRLFGLLIANGLGQALGAVAVAALVRHGFDVLVSTPPAADLRTLATTTIGLLGVTLALSWLRWRTSLDAERLGQDYVHAVRMRLFRHLARVGVTAAGRISHGALLLRFVGDLAATRNWVSLGLARLTVAGLATAASLVALALIQPVIAIAVGLSTLLSAVLVATLGPRMRTRNLTARRQRGRYAALLNDRIAGITVVESFGQERREIRRVRRASARLRAALIDRAAVVGLLRALAEASAGLASLIALLVGATQAAAGRASPGDVVAAMVVAGLLAPRLRELARVYEYWAAATVAREKQLQVLGLGTRRGRRGRQPLPAGLQTLELRGVSLAPLFDRLDLRIEPGERLAVIGANGCGKSTLLRLLAGTLQPEHGGAYFGNQQLRRTRWAEIRGAFAMVAPDLPLLRGSLRLNLTYGLPGADPASVAQVLTDCRLQGLVDRLPHGLETRLTPDTGGLSTGERARIAIARALLTAPRVLLLDEADANLDPTSRAVMDDMFTSFTGTIVCVTHDEARVATADHAIEIASGGVRQLSRDEAVARLAELRRSGHRHDLRLVS